MPVASGVPALLAPAPAPATSSRTIDASDSESDAELVSHIHPDLLIAHQNALNAQGQAPNGTEDAGTTGAETAAGTGNESACLWSGCGKLFGRLEELVQHIHKEHVGTSKSTYKCMWEGCQLFGVTRTSRFALIGHIRSHTGERPFTCKLPECDKSFTRSDALTKHMRVVHGIEPLAPHHQARPAGTGAGGSTSHGAKGKSTGKKRKRGGRADDESDEEELPAGVLESGDDDGLDDGIAGTEDDTWGPVGRRRRSRKSKAGPGIGTGVKIEDTGVYGAPTGSRDLWSEDESDYEALEREADEMGLVGGNTLSKAKYLTVKAKYRFALAEHERLLERLTFEIEEVKRLKDSKDEALNDLIRRQFGSAAEQLINPIPAKGSTSVTHA